MKKEHSSGFGFVDRRILLGSILCFSISLGASALAQENSDLQFGQSYHNDISPALRDLFGGFINRLHFRNLTKKDCRSKHSSVIKVLRGTVAATPMAWCKVADY